MIQMIFNGIVLTKYGKITKGFSPLNGANYDVTLQDFVGDGSYFVRKRSTAKTLVVPFFMGYKSIEDYDALQSALNVDGPSMLTFSNLPDRYFNAMPVGDLDYQEFKNNNGFGKITFIIPDGVSHSTSYIRFTDYTISGDKVIFTLQNNGNKPALPIIRIKNSSENGYVSIVNQTGAFAMGDEETIDSETREYSLRPFDYSDSGTKIADGFAKGAKNVAILNDTSQTLDNTLYIGPLWGRDHLALSGTVPPTGVHAGSLTWNLPADGSLYDKIWWRQIFWTGGENTYGFIKVMVSDTDGKFLYGVESIKRSRGTEVEYNLLVADGQGGYQKTKFAKTFEATPSDQKNPFNQNRGWSDIIRNDDELLVYWFGSHIPINCPTLKGKKSAKLHVALGSMQGKPLVTYMFVDGIKYTKNNAYLPPNPYGAGSEILINMENKTIAIDGVKKLNEKIQGSKFLTVPKGTSKMEFDFSTWIESKPEISISFEERKS